MWKKPWFLSQGPGWGLHVLTYTNDGRLSHRLGSGHEWSLCPRSEGRSPSHVATSISWRWWQYSSFETLSPRPERPSCASAHRQYVGWSLTYWLTFLCLERPHNVHSGSPRTHPAPLGLDAMVQTWPSLRMYAFPFRLLCFPGVLE